MDLCVVNVEKLRRFSKRKELRIELTGEESSKGGLTRHFIVNGVHTAMVGHDNFFGLNPNNLHGSVEEDIDWLRTLINESIKRGEPWTKKLW